MDGRSAIRKAATYTQNKRTQTSMPSAGFEPTIPDFERTKTVHALDRVVTVISKFLNNGRYFLDEESEHCGVCTLANQRRDYENTSMLPEGLEHTA
jgi:hypothetical protein